MKPQTYSAVLDPNAAMQNVVNPIVTIGGSLRRLPQTTNLAESVGGRLGTLSPINQTIGDMRGQAREITNQFRALAGQNGYNPVDKSVQAAGVAANRVMVGINKVIARWKSL